MDFAWIPVWKKAPFLRLIIPLMIGILLQWYNQFDLLQILFSVAGFVIAFIAFQFLPLSLRFKFQTLQGFLINLILIALGLFVTYQKNVRHHQNWFGNFYHDSNYIIVTINEPLLQKNKSYKAEAIVNTVLQPDTAINTTGKIIIYFEKDSSGNLLQYGDKILINKKLQGIKNSGNPGAFNYQRYSAFKQIFHNVFLKNQDWIILSGAEGSEVEAPGRVKGLSGVEILNEKNINHFNQFLFSARQNVLNILQKNMQGKDDQLSIAEALLIGYTEDLDKDLVQAYSNTGVVHIIAISGMHLALIYVMLVWIFNKIPFVKRSKILKVIFVLSCLWLFAMLTGGAASILRSAVMFSCIVIGENFARKASIYNSLAASAFILLCYNPYFLWDVGFQLSYFAVLGIVIFQKPIYHLLFVKNKLLQKIWALMSVSLAAQIFTFPICIYYFHQFPTIFLFTNIIMVPLSTIILFVEIALITLAWVPFVGALIGKLTWCLVWFMNKIILWFNDLPFALWDKLPASVTSTLLLYGIVICIGFWLLNKSKIALKFSLIMLMCFVSLNAYEKWQISNQQRLIVYNVPQHQSIDFIKGNTFKFVGDSVLLVDGMLQNFHLKPGRIMMQVNKKTDSLSTLFQRNNFYQFNEKKILVVDKPITFESSQQKINVDYVIISKSPKLYINQLVQTFNCRKIIFDGSNSLWKIAKWKKDCEALHLPCYSVPEQGAFVTDL